MPKLPVLTAHRLISALQRAGFEKTRQKGSHLRLKHPDGRIVTVPVHSGRDIGRGLLRKILRDVEWTVDDLQKFLE
jgi:predicted RNA binding protein YcfA (HicA-like mRNA interferase family)